MRKGTAPPEGLLETLRQQVGKSDDWKTYSCELVTPMYGGGVKTGEVDRQMPIRASSIRGQLRFWWRIACGPFASSTEMFRCEKEIWGGIGKEGPMASKVNIRVICSGVTDNQLVQSDQHEYGNTIKYAYGAAANNGAKMWLKEGYEFSIGVRCADELADQVNAALRWWANFGGVGARTRRGFGAVMVEALSIDSVPDTIISKANCKIASLQPTTFALNAWKQSAEKLQKFRQGPGFARSSGQGNRPGRSYWPEPDQLRRDTGMNDNGQHIPKHESKNAFPRAAFGLPIIFDFHKQSEPNKAWTELLPKVGERMASPLILRPGFIDGQWHATALLLPTWIAALRQELRYKNLPGKTPHSWHSAWCRNNEIGKYICPKNTENYRLLKV